MDNTSPPIPPWELERQRKESEARKTAAKTPSPMSSRSPATGGSPPSQPRRDAVVRSLSFSPSPGGPSPPLPPPPSQSSSPSFPFLKSPLIGAEVGNGDDDSSSNLDRHSVSGPDFSVTVVARSGFTADLSLSARLDVDAETAFAMLVDPEPAPWKHATVLRRRVISGGGGGAADGGAAAPAAADGGAAAPAAADAPPSSSSSSPPAFASLSPRTVEVEQAARWAFFRSVTTRLLVREVSSRVFFLKEKSRVEERKKKRL
jgi:hypothetical protein